MTPVNGLYNLAACSNSTTSLSLSHLLSLSICPSCSHAVVLSTRYLSYLACFSRSFAKGLKTCTNSFFVSVIGMKSNSVASFVGSFETKLTFRPITLAMASVLAVSASVSFAFATASGGLGWHFSTGVSPNNSPRAAAVSSCRPNPVNVKIIIYIFFYHF